MAYNSRFTISSAAADRKLTTAADVLAATGLTVTDALILQVSDAIARECRVAASGVAQPTMRAETLIETFRLSRRDAEGAWPYEETARRSSSLFLARMPVSSVTSIVADGTALAADEFELHGAEGRIVRLVSDCETAWAAQKIVVTYVAGFSTVPEDLKLAAILAVQEKSSATGRDPLLRGESHEGLGSMQYFQSTTSPGGLPAAVVDMLAPYRNLNA